MKKPLDEKDDIEGDGNGIVPDTEEDIGKEGTETEEDIGQIDPSILARAVVTGTDWTAETLVKQLEKGSIRLDPIFQRRDAWSENRKSKFIESIILGLPIPQIVLAESQETKGTFVVIDGKQRLLTLQRFAGINLEPDTEPLRLAGLTVIEALKGRTLTDLREDAQLTKYLSAFENQTIRTVVVRNWQSEKVLYIIFHRLNTGSVPLSPQELRQALHPGEFLSFAAKYSEQSAGLKKALNLTKPDFRMRDVELLVRYYAYRNFIVNYPGNLKEFLDDTCKSLNREWKSRRPALLEQAKQLEFAIKAVFKIFGSTGAFRKWDGTRFERRLNRATFDIMVYYFSQTRVRKAAIASRDDVRRAFKGLCSKNDPFRRSIETTTKSIEANKVRFSVWGHTLAKTLRITVDVPKLKKVGGKK